MRKIQRYRKRTWLNTGHTNDDRSNQRLALERSQTLLYLEILESSIAQYNTIQNPLDPS
jgi:hypothetical protein